MSQILGVGMKVKCIKVPKESSFVKDSIYHIMSISEADAVALSHSGQRSSHCDYVYCCEYDEDRIDFDEHFELVR